jgi:hypothetical protein
MQYSTLHAAARAYAIAGIPVFPCKVKGKQPVTENGFYDATTDLGKIDLWWESDEYNVAFCPDDAGLFIVDIDPGATLKPEELPPTYTVRTPRGGFHLYFEGSGRSSSNRLASHVDTRGVGGYALLPPSVTESGKYTVKLDKPYHPLPVSITEALQTADTAVTAAVENLDLPININSARHLLKTLIEKGDVAVEGCGGDDRTYRLCCEVLDFGLSPHTAQALIEEIWNPHCAPPWDADELEVKLKNASKFRQNEVGAYGNTTSQEAFGDAIKKLSPEEKLSRFYFKDEQEMEDEPDPKWLVKDLISERSTVMLYGPSGSYKSFLALDICLAISTGTSTFGSECASGLVFYGALEGRAHLRKARRAWRILHGVEGRIENFFVGLAPMIAVDGEMQEFGDEINKRCAGRRPSLIVIDTLSKSMAGMNENDAADAGKFIRFCDSLVEVFGCTVLAIHHTGKEEGRGARGSSAFVAGFDTVLEVKAHKNCKAVEVYVRKHKDAEERETPWTFEGRVIGPSLAFEQTTREQNRLLVGESKDITPKKVGAALKELRAFGEDGAVITAVLAAHLTPAKETESVEEHQAAVGRAGRALNAQSKGWLEAYCFRKGRNLYWFLPIPD